MKHADVVIVGGGHAGAQVAISLREKNYPGTILIISEEPDLPYERPCMSKTFLSGEAPFDRTLLRKPDFWASRDIRFLQPVRAVAVNPRNHELALEDGETIGYGKLVWAAGAAPRHLSCSGRNATGVHYLRTRADVDGIKADLGNAERVAVIGGGYLGLEAASVLQEAGKQVVVIEAQDRILARVTGTAVSEFIASLHRHNGVDIRTSEQVKQLCVSGGGRVAGVELESGEVIPAQLVIVGIGIVPNVVPLLEAGAAGLQGVLVDEYCQTSLEDIYAIGDCTLQPNRFGGETPVRIESIQNANDQAVVAARHIVGELVANDAIPWFWSKQFNVKLQTIGMLTAHDHFEVCGTPEGGSFAVVYAQSGRIIAIDCINSTKSFVQGRKLIGKTLSDEDLSVLT